MKYGANAVICMQCLVGLGLPEAREYTVIAIIIVFAVAIAIVIVIIIVINVIIFKK